MPFTSDDASNFQPELIYAPPRYDNTTEGLGRYYVVEDPYQDPVQQGLLWTDDEDVLGWAPANNALGPLVSAIPRLLLKLRAKGESATDAFVLIIGMTPGDLYADADLAEIPRILAGLNPEVAS